MENGKKAPRKARPPVRWVVVSEPPTPAQLEHRTRLEAEGFRVRFIRERDLAAAG